jgi:diguanylate cyclase (GGDEF)-like protein
MSVIYAGSGDFFLGMFMSIGSRQSGLHSRAKYLVALVVFITLGFSFVFTAVLVQMAKSDRQAALVAADNVVATISSDISRNIDLYDLSLQAVVDGLKLPQINSLDSSLRQMVLFDRAATAKDLGSILVINQFGEVTIDSRSSEKYASNFTGADFFKAQQDRADVGLYISKPWVMPSGEYVISMSRRMSNSDGSFAGVVVGNMQLSYFHDLFRNVKGGPGDTMALMRADGTALMRSPFQIRDIGMDLSKSSVFSYLPHSRSGSYEKASFLDGVKRLYVYHQLPRYPLVLVSGMSIDTIYAAWRLEAAIIGAFVVLLCLVNIVLVVSLTRELRRRTKVEATLEVMARTDGLTGLCNRRAFDERLKQEWLRAKRDQSSIAVLMIDADYFKAYNDTFGHQAGDKALVQIAGCISTALKRPADICARYGGEEFIVLLPGASADGARIVANAIHANVLSSRAADVTIPSRMPTVSIGVCAAVPSSGVTTARLIKGADDALYEAKRNGRDRIEIGMAQCVPNGEESLAA